MRGPKSSPRGVPRALVAVQSHPPWAGVRVKSEINVFLNARRLQQAITDFVVVLQVRGN